MNGIIHISQITKSYIMGKQILPVIKGVSLDIFKSEYVALMGPSGSGKSTLMNILGCLDTPTSGLYILNGNDVSQMDDNALADIRNKEIGFVFQQFNLLPRLTALENVALPLVYAGLSKKMRNKKAMEVLDMVNLSDRSHHKPNELSGGQSQRVAIARTLANNPTVLLCDEATSALDSESEKLIQDALKKLMKGRTTIVIAHRLSTIQHMDRIVVLDNGQITEQGTHTELLKAIEEVKNGKVYVSSEVNKVLVEDLQHDGEKPLLTTRELEIVRLIVKEFSNKQIAEALFISERTVETHRKNILRKTRVGSIVGLIKYAYANKLV